MPDWPREITEKVVKWYELNGRKGFPWRRTRNPYKVLIAELMLQKTHGFQQVLPVYSIFLERYPNVHSLFEARVEDIRESIRSLGLQNTRSRRLKDLASVVTNRFGGRIPRKYDNLTSLPGVGEYIANAVLCMAFDERRPMVDANFGRVLGRAFYGEEDYPPSKDKTWKIAKELIPEVKYKEFNLGIIDLGALICKPRGPLCTVCPLSEKCDFFSAMRKRCTHKSQTIN